MQGGDDVYHLFPPEQVVMADLTAILKRSSTQWTGSFSGAPNRTRTGSNFRRGGF
jgi:hypothetical protein